MSNTENIILTNEIMNFIEKSPVCFQAVENISDILLSKGYRRSVSYTHLTLPTT